MDNRYKKIDEKSKIITDGLGCKIDDGIRELIVNYEKIVPRRFVFHTSNKRNRESILKNGLVVGIGDSYKDNWVEFEPIKPAIFAVNTPNYIESFGLKYSNDYDIWRIDTQKCDNDWFIDFNMGGDNIMTFDNIPIDCISLFRQSGEWKL